MITVKSGAPGKVGLWERHPDHPGGEAWVTDRPVEVAETAAVRAALKDGRLVAVDAATANKPDVCAQTSEPEAPTARTAVTKRPSRKRKSTNG